MKPLTRALVIVNLVILLGYTLWYVRAKETILAEGELLLLQLAPVDPRSLIQGDYMVLRYAATNEYRTDTIPKTGYLIVRPDADGVAQPVRLQASVDELDPNEYAINYTRDDWRMNIGAESFFFEEGKGETFSSAKYGGLRVDKKGNSLLVGLYDGDRRALR